MAHIKKGSLSERLKLDSIPCLATWWNVTIEL